MGVYGTNSCNKNSIIYPIMYIVVIITLLIIGILYETDIIPKTAKYTQESVWWYGFVGLIGVMIMLILVNYLFKYIKPSELTKTHFWYLSHILCYFAVTLVSPGQWPFWLAIGITWELFECYLSCSLSKQQFPISCSGMYDITANLAGMAIAMWVRSEIPIKQLNNSYL
jgi:hypothetical protein